MWKILMKLYNHFLIVYIKKKFIRILKRISPKCRFSLVKKKKKKIGKKMIGFLGKLKGLMKMERQSLNVITNVIPTIHPW